MAVNHTFEKMLFIVNNLIYWANQKQRSQKVRRETRALAVNSPSISATVI